MALLPMGFDGQIQSDWNQTSSSEKDYIKNKPNITGWENVGRITSTVGEVYLYRCSALKMGIIYFAAGSSASNGTFTLPNNMKALFTLAGALRNNGYIRVNIQSGTGDIVNSVAYSIGQLVFLYY